MKFKLDENLGPSVQEVFLRRGHDCRTAREQRLGGAPDEPILGAAIAEGRILVTMDHDFGNVLRYSPESTSGIAILSPQTQASKKLLRFLAEALLVALERKTIRGKLWIVEPSRIREHEPENLSFLDERER
jgi:predicted nuclease of predicted toxin-antitoxin system